MSLDQKREDRADRERDLRCSRWSGVILRLYRFRRLRSLCVRLAGKLEGGQFYSATLRRIVERFHGVSVGAYSYGPCLAPGRFPAGVRVGRYVSIGPGVQVFRRNHPLERLSMHPFFYNSDLGYLQRDSITQSELTIGHDAWIGAQVIVTPGCRRIGIGAVVGAGAVVTKDVPDFAVAVGNPARVIRFRFEEELRHKILASRWWEQSVEDCVRHMDQMIQPVEMDPERTPHPLLQESRVA